MKSSFAFSPLRAVVLFVLLLTLIGLPRTLAQQGIQSAYVDEASSRLPGGLFPGLAIAVGDVDNDNDVDVYVGTDVGPARDILLINDGRGRFENDAVRRLPPKEADAFTRGVRLVDLDGDGDLDVLVALARQISGTTQVAGEGNQVFINNGQGFFSDESTVRMPGLTLLERDDRSYDVAAGDVNGDGAADFFFANLAEASRLWINNGRGVFSNAPDFLPTTIDSLNSTSTDMGDVDGDGDLDLIIGVGIVREGLPHLLINDGQGRFDDQTTFRLAQEIAVNALDSRFVDVDGDGDLDLFFCNFPTRAVLLINNGQGFFSDETSLKLPIEAASCTGLDVGDFDGDGDLDIALGRNPNDPITRRNVLLINSDGQGHFIATPLSGDGGGFDVAFFDADGDGDLDLIGFNKGEHHLWINKR